MWPDRDTTVTGSINDDIMVASVFLNDLRGDAGNDTFEVLFGGAGFVRGGSGTLTSDTGGKATATTVVQTGEIFDGIVDGQIHPMVAALQNRLYIKEGDQRFGLCVLLALRASAPRFNQGRA